MNCVPGVSDHNFDHADLSMRDAVAAHENTRIEVAILDVIPGKEAEFEAAFSQASVIISSMTGYISDQLQHCIENNNRYLLLVNWQSLESHTVGFRTSPQYQESKKSLHHFYNPFQTVNIMQK